MPLSHAVSVSARGVSAWAAALRPRPRCCPPTALRQPASAASAIRPTGTQRSVALHSRAVSGVVMERHMETLSQPRSEESRRLRVLTWNTLADGLAQGGEFTAPPPEVLDWPHRWPLILQELLRSGADVLCLQEVNHFADVLQPALKAAGYEGIFLPKRESPCVALGAPPDGLALLWRASRWAPAGPSQQAAYVAAESGVPQSQVRLVIRLKEFGTGLPLLVGTTHLKAKASPANDATRAAQASQLMEDVARMAAATGAATGAGAEEGSGSSPSEGPAGLSAPPGVSPGPAGPPLGIVVCGDFNAEPDSAAVSIVQAHPLKLRSLWEGVPCSPGEDGCEGAHFTTWKIRPAGEKRSTIDYLWAGPGLRPLARWAQPSPERIGPAALPSRDYPSDHLALMGEYEWPPELEEAGCN